MKGCAKKGLSFIINLSRMGMEKVQCIKSYVPQKEGRVEKKCMCRPVGLGTESGISHLLRRASSRMSQSLLQEVSLLSS